MDTYFFWIDIPLSLQKFWKKISPEFSTHYHIISAIFFPFFFFFLFFYSDKFVYCSEKEKKNSVPFSISAVSSVKH